MNNKDRYTQYLICKERGHTLELESGVIPALVDYKLKYVCIFCETEVKATTTNIEVNPPIPDED